MATVRDLLSQIDGMVEEIVRTHQDLIRIPSVNTGTMPTGNETPVAKHVADWLAKDGIKSEILESAPGRGSIIARMEGASGKAGLMLMSHLDVVPVEDESKWSVPPFGGMLKNGRVYGRGASDCKSLLTAQMFAMRTLKRSGVKLKEGLILASGADEEHGGRYGFGWIAKHHPEKIMAKYAVNEGGGYPTETAAGTAYVMNLGEKGRLQVELTIKGTSAHASMPWTGTNALFKLAQVLQRIEAYEPVRDTSAEMFKSLSLFAIEDKPSPENIDSIVSELEKTNKSMSIFLKAASRMTFTPTMIRGGIKSNSVPESIRLTCDVRTLPFQDDKYVRKEIEKCLEGIDGVDIDIDYMAVPTDSPYGTKFTDEIKKATIQALGRDDLQWIPGLCVGFTDSRFTRELGIQTYDFAGTHPDDDPLACKVHGTDESEGVASLVSSTKVMLALAHNMLV
ncbi:MAG: M20/M25/M40 family metallo-hydrolase [SAR202 cluster bacterium]|nr:M20/M25/M40 family metallo-hydrolase [SAR202 cluster bacterium]